MMVYVEEYFNRFMLRKLGYQFDPNDLSVADVEAFTIIHSVINKHKNDTMKRMKGKNRHGKYN